MRKKLISCLAISLMIIFLTNGIAFAAQTVQTEKKVTYLYGVNIWDTAYQDAYKVYVANTEKELDVKINKLEKKLKGINVTYEGQKIAKYAPLMYYVNEDWSTSMIMKFKTNKKYNANDQGWGYGLYIEADLITAPEYSGYNWAQTNNVPVEMKKMLKAVYIVIMERVLNEEDIKK